MKRNYSNFYCNLLSIMPHAQKKDEGGKSSDGAASLRATSQHDRRLANMAPLTGDTATFGTSSEE